MLSWKSHTHWLMSKLCSACYAIRAVKPYMMSQETIRMIYFSYVHSVMTYGIIFWDNSLHNIHIFGLQKKIITINTNSRGRDSCRELFRNLENFPLHSQYCIYFPFCYSWLKIENNINLTPRFMASTQHTPIISIICHLI
jgi:hypothetical protein